MGFKATTSRAWKVMTFAKRPTWVGLMIELGVACRME